ncbi:MAG: hypothetical protein JKY56_21095 [Kofleriaceae bacterium]|nr:hypothetical protein [Kofleriaceae bacterium]
MSDKRVASFIFVLLAAWTISCGGPSKTTNGGTEANGVQSGAKAKRVRNGLSDDFRSIPADSVFVFASLDSRAGIIPALVRFVKPIVATAFKERLTDSGKADAREMAILAKLTTPEGLDQIGIDPRPNFAMYMIGRAGVLRVEIKDGAALEKFILDSADDGAGVSFKKRGDWRYWQGETDDGLVVVAIQNRELLIGIMKSQDAGRVLPMLLDGVLPQRSIVDTGVLDTLSKRYPGQALAYIDTVALFDMMAKEDESVRAMSPTCITEIRSVVGIVPKLVFSFEQSSQDEYVFHTAVELRKDIARDLSNVVAPIPAYDIVTRSGSSMTLGLGLKVEKAILWMQNVATGIEQQPYQCEELADFNSVLSVLPKLSLIPPVVNELTGFVISLEHMEPDDPGSIIAVGAVQSWNPNALLNFIKGSLPFPAIANIELSDDGAIVEIAAGELGIPQQVYLAMGGRMLGFAVGQSDSDLSGIVTSPASSHGPFLAIHYDYSQWSHLVDDDDDDDDDDMSPAMQAVVKKALNSLGPVGFSVFATKFGIHSKTTIELK